MFEKLFGSMARHPIGSELLFWLIIFGVVCWLVTMLVRFWTGRGRNIALQSIGTIAAHRSWQEWIRGAQDAAARGEFREAIHLLYWAGITRLEDLSILTVDHTRTPREQLRLLSNPAKSGTLMRRFRDACTACTHVGTHDPTRARMVWPPPGERRRFSRMLETR